MITDGFLASRKNLPRAADAETIIRRFGRAADLDGVFVDHVLVGFGVALLLSMSQPGLEERVDELSPDWVSLYLPRKI